jgi:glycosyltransferase involved in cell wall biosynthesis
VVVLLDSNWSGHHPTYFKAFASALLELGYEVHAICPEPEEFFESMGPEMVSGGRLTLHRWNPPEVKVWPRRFAEPVHLLCANRWMVRELKRMERDAGRKIELVFFACLYDGFLKGFPRRFPWPWVGLYLQVRAFRMPGKPLPYTKFVPDPRKLFRSPGLRGLGVLDEGAVRYLQEATRCRNVEAFPDLTDESPPRCEGVAAALNEFASGRPIVGVAGFLQPTKGIVTLARVAEWMREADVVFAFVGEMLQGVYSAEEELLLARVFAQPNVFVSLERVPDGPLFNGVLDLFAVIFAAYENFPHSSNILTKAAFLEKPVVVSDGYLMAERVREYGLGAVVPEADVQAIARAITDLLGPGGVFAESSRFGAYVEIHSVAMLRGAMARLLDRDLARGTAGPEQT